MDSLTDDSLYDALLRRDPSFEGRAYVGVRTTGIFCRLSCPAPKPKRENTAFYGTAAQCLAAGLRPCKRCRPLDAAAAPEPLVGALLQRLEAEPERRWSEAALISLGYDPSTVRRAFRRTFGTTFLELARLHRLRIGTRRAAAGGPAVEAQLDAGFASASGFRAALAKFLGRPPSALMARTGLRADFLDTPLGPMLAVADRGRIWLLEFADRREVPREIAAVEKEAGGALSLGTTPALERLTGELETYFDGETAEFSARPMSYGSEFLRKVHTELRAIPSGTTQSYKEIAERIGRPGAVRAVARANAANRLAIIVPCHRVIGADGRPSGYAGGVWRKRWLIEHERRMAESQVNQK